MLIYIIEYALAGGFYCLNEIFNRMHLSVNFFYHSIENDIFKHQQNAYKYYDNFTSFF